ncbi:MAG: ABC transporter permease [Bacteroidales bacterium]|nr:ABC transporter permease [Bacteroidales bacterium]
MNVPLFIARRYLFARKSHNVINIISAISAAGMAIGTAALILILSIYNGFEGLVKDNLGGVDPDYVVAPSKGKVFIPEGPVFDSLYADGRIAGISSILEDNVFVSYASHQGIARAKGVDAVFEEESPFREKIVDGEFLLHKGFMPTAVVGAGLASKMEVNPAFVSRLEIYFPDREKNISLSNPSASLESIALRPAGIFSVNTQIDDELMILPIESMRELLGYEKEISSLEIRLSDSLTAKESKKLRKDLEKAFGPGFKVLDSVRQHESLYRMMKYEKAAIFLILIFIIIIISFNVFGSLSMLIIEKKEDIGTLRSLGAKDSTVKGIFILEGWMITLLGLAVGLAVGAGLALLQQKFSLIKMPGDYFGTAYPVVLKWTDIALTAIVVAIIGYVIALLPAIRRSQEDD